MYYLLSPFNWDNGSHAVVPCVSKLPFLVGPLQYCHEVAIYIPLVAKATVAIHSKTPYEACVERSFNHEGLLYFELRSTQDDDSIRDDI